MKQLLLTICIALTALTTVQAQKKPLNQEARKLSMALYAISNLYVDSVDNSKVVEDAIVGMLEKLDPHSNYMDVEETKQMTEPLVGNFDGIGIQFNLLTDTLYVIQVIPGGPSEKVGLLAGDRILAVDDTIISGVDMKTPDIMRRLRGEKGTAVHVKVQRGTTNPAFIEFKIIRDKIPIYSLDASYMLDKKTGYIKLNRFASTTADEFRDALKELQAEGMEQLILDLQYNGGGYLNIAIELADEFLKKDQLIVYTEGDKQPKSEAKATNKGAFESGRLVVLVDESSASASEIVAGAVQDWDRGVIVGRRTFGKGLVQKPIPLPDGSMMRLTVARYYTPTGRSIQKPYEKGDKELYDRELIERYNNGELIHADSVHFPDSLKYNTLENRRVVYGGGGVMPDKFIPVDTTRFTNYHRELLAKGVINRFTMNYIDKHRAELTRQYANIKTYQAKFEITDLLLQELKALAETEKIAFNEMEYNKALPIIKLQIKALIARDLFEMNEYFIIMNQQDESLKEALRIINSTKAYNKLLGN